MFSGLELSHVLCALFGFALAWWSKGRFHSVRDGSEPPEEAVGVAGAQGLEQDYHFLFNSLSTIRFLTKEDAKKAGDLVLRLSSFLKFRWSTLREHELRRELEYCQAYLLLEEARLEERLGLDWSVETWKNSPMIERGSLVTYLERLLAEGIRKEREGGRVSLEAKLEGANYRVQLYASTGLPELSDSLKELGVEWDGAERWVLELSQDGSGLA